MLVVWSWSDGGVQLMVVGGADGAGLVAGWVGRDADGFGQLVMLIGFGCWWWC